MEATLLELQYSAGDYYIIYIFFPDNHWLTKCRYMAAYPLII